MKHSLYILFFTFCLSFQTKAGAGTFIYLDQIEVIKCSESLIGYEFSFETDNAKFKAPVACTEKALCNYRKIGWGVPLIGIGIKINKKING